METRRALALEPDYKNSQALVVDPSDNTVKVNPATEVREPQAMSKECRTSAQPFHSLNFLTFSKRTVWRCSRVRSSPLWNCGGGPERLDGLTLPRSAPQKSFDSDGSVDFCAPVAWRPHRSTDRRTVRGQKSGLWEAGPGRRPGPGLRADCRSRTRSRPVG